VRAHQIPPENIIGTASEPTLFVQLSLTILILHEIVVNKSLNITAIDLPITISHLTIYLPFKYLEMTNVTMRNKCPEGVPLGIIDK
jgi:hypothetical protein